MENYIQVGRRNKPPKGFTYLMLLIGIAILGLGLSALSEMSIRLDLQYKWTQAKWIGSQYKDAISSYYYSAHRGVFTYPTKVADLIEDNRFAPPKRHLRQIYASPFSPNESWAPLKNGNAIVGFGLNQSNEHDGEIKYQILFTPNTVQR